MHVLHQKFSYVINTTTYDFSTFAIRDQITPTVCCQIDIRLKRKMANCIIRCFVERHVTSSSLSFVWRKFATRCDGRISTRTRNAKMGGNEREREKDVEMVAASLSSTQQQQQQNFFADPIFFYFMVHYTKDNLLFVYEHTLTYVRIGGVDSSVLSVLRSRLQVCRYRCGISTPWRCLNAASSSSSTSLRRSVTRRQQIEAAGCTIMAEKKMSKR